MTAFKHLTLDDRCTIQMMLDKKASFSEIGRVIDVHICFIVIPMPYRKGPQNATMSSYTALFPRVVTFPPIHWQISPL